MPYRGARARTRSGRREASQWPRHFSVVGALGTPSGFLDARGWFRRPSHTGGRRDLGPFSAYAALEEASQHCVRQRSSLCTARVFARRSPSARRAWLTRRVTQDEAATTSDRGRRRGTRRFAALCDQHVLLALSRSPHKSDHEPSTLWL